MLRETRPVRRTWLDIAVTVGAGLVAVAALAAWLSATPARELEPRVPIGEDAWERDRVSAVAKATNFGTLIPGPGQPAAEGGSWPQFRGPNRDGIARDSVPLARRWSPGGLPVVWQLTVGEGHAGVAVHRGRVYLIDYDRERQEDAIRCLSLADGS